MDVIQLRALVARGRVIWSRHTVARLLLRDIPQSVVREAIMTGEVIEDYPRDRPFPSCLILGWVDGAPYHVVVSLDPTIETVYVITAYEPSPDRFGPDYRIRR